MFNAQGGELSTHTFGTFECNTTLTNCAIAGRPALCYGLPMSADPFHLNRPIHLARRDVFYLKAVEQIRTLASLRNLDKKCRTAEQAFYLLCEARRHARAANRSGKTSEQSSLFEEVLDIAADHLLSVCRMINRRLIVSASDSPLDRLFRSAEPGAEMDRLYRRCIAQLIKGILSMLDQAEKPFESLRSTSLSKMSATDRARYNKAFSHFDQRAMAEAKIKDLFPEEQDKRELC